MQLGMIGLGRMGANLTRRLMRDGGEVVVVDVHAGTAPLRGPRYCQFGLGMAAVAEAWRRGSVTGSWLPALTAGALGKPPGLGGCFGRVSGSGEGRWMVAAAADAGVPGNVVTTALDERFSWRGEAGFGGQLPSAMRHLSGGRVEKAAAGAR